MAKDKADKIDIDLDETIKPFIKRIIKGYYKTLGSTGKLLATTGADISIKEATDTVSEEFDMKLARLIDTSFTLPELRDGMYKKRYDLIKALRGKGKSWGDIRSEIEAEVYSINEIIVRLIEEETGVEITSAKQLQDLTGIKDKDAVKIIFTQAMYYRYNVTLVGLLEGGATYKDLNKITPKDFNLPDKWEGCLASDQYSCILWAIEGVYLLHDQEEIASPVLRDIAEDLQSPYSVILDAHKLVK